MTKQSPDTTASGPVHAQVKYLLDVNTIIAAITVNHPDYQKADAWVQGKRLVTCPLSELGFLRVATNPKALKLSMAAALPALKSTAQKSEQVTDRYLADLAASKGLRLATLDTGIPHAATELMK